jgi:hypothetical protein
MRILSSGAALAMLAFGAIGVPAARAQTADYDPMGYHSGIAGYFRHWDDRANAAQAAQPHWPPPLVTVTPRLVQAIRYDQYWESSYGFSTDVYNANHFLELIPTTTNEVLINPPAYQVHSGLKRTVGCQFITIQQRLLAANFYTLSRLA